MFTRCPHGWLLPEGELTCLDDLEVVLRCERNPAVSVRFAERHVAVAPEDDRLLFVVGAQAPGLEVRLAEVTLVVAPGLIRFLDGLDFHGWQGEQQWVNADRDLTITARFGSGGHIALMWTLRPWRSDYGDWEVTVTTWLEAGAAKDDFAVRLHDFLELS